MEIVLISHLIPTISRTPWEQQSSQSVYPAHIVLNWSHLHLSCQDSQRSSPFLISTHLPLSRTKLSESHVKPFQELHVEHHAVDFALAEQLAFAQLVTPQTHAVSHLAPTVFKDQLVSTPHVIATTTTHAPPILAILVPDVSTQQSLATTTTHAQTTFAIHP
jgi:hypothetical protein